MWVKFYRQQQFFPILSKKHHRNIGCPDGSNPATFCQEQKISFLSTDTECHCARLLVWYLSFLYLPTGLCSPWHGNLGQHHRDCASFHRNILCNHTSLLSFCMSNGNFDKVLTNFYRKMKSPGMR